ncbi:MAG: DUF4836 family protein [Microscillaceae bacterium]|nr:DUF4836 family protein [Microscillaceae bacterium]
MIWIFAPLLFQSCGNPVENSKYIPKDASLVLCFNLANFSQKASDWQKLLNNDIPFLNIKKNEIFADQLKDSGIDFNSVAYFFSNFYVENQESYYALSIRLSNESKFDEFLRKAFAQVPEIKSYAGLRYAVLGNKSIIGWVNKVALIINRENKTDEKNLRDALLKLRDIPEGESLKANNKQFQRLRLSEYDMAAWVNLESYEWLVKQSIRRSLLPVVVNLKDNYLTAVTKFEDGQILVDTKLHNMNQSLKEYQDVIKKGIDQELVHHLPQFAPLAIVGLGLDMKGIKRLVNSIMLQYVADQTLELTGSSPDQILDMLSGDIVAILKDIKSDSTRQPNYEYVIGLGIKQISTLDKILSTFKENGILTGGDSTYYAPEQDMYIVKQNNILFVTSSSGIRDDILQIKDQEPETNLSTMANESFFMAYANVEKETREKLPEELFNGDKILEGITKFTETPFESFSINTLPVKDSVSRTRFVLALKEKKKNSLQMLVNAFKNESQKKPN